MKRLAFLVSGNGSNMQAVFDAIDQKKINAEVVVVIASKPDCFALERAKKYDIDTFVVSSSQYKPEERDAFIDKILERYSVDFIVLGGYLSILSPQFVEKYPRRIVNIHPSLLPQFGGKGMYGLNVHKAVIASRARISGATVHYVDSGTDTGEIIAQQSLDVLDTDTPESLQARVLNTIEHKLLPESLALLCK